MSLTMETIETPRLILRPMEPGDAAALCALGCETTKALYLPDWVMDEEEAAGLIRHFRQRIENPDPRTGPVVWAVVLKEAGSLIGNVGIGPKEELGGEVEVGYAISEQAAGRGLATEAAKAAVWWAFERAGLQALTAIVLPENKASRRVLDKLGFVLAGSRRLEHGGKTRLFDYFRLYHLDGLSSTQWELGSYGGEPMEQFFNRRVEGYEEHMMEYPDAQSSYTEASAPIAATMDAIEVLDLGCGTGLELKALFERAPNARVTCVDLSCGMLKKLKENYRDALGQITIVQASYIDWQYPAAAFDYALSVNTMHHFWENQKLGIYRKILGALKPGGCYIESDYMVDEIMMEQCRRRYWQIVESQGIANSTGGFLHIDIPFTPMLQKQLLTFAGFSMVRSYIERIEPEGSKAILVATK
jgi:tRNA (cmo5U34)-methyltransferase